MRKTKDPHWQPPPHRPCSYCNGTGEVRGMFHSAPCVTCDGAGIVGEDGEAIPPADLIALLRMQRDNARRHVRRLVNTPGVRDVLERHWEALAEKERERQRERENSGYGAGGARYYGD